MNSSKSRIIKVCACGTPFEVLAMAANRTNRCHECYLANPHKIDKICEQCGITYPALYSQRKISRFHDKSCKAKWFSEHKLNGFVKGEEHYMWKGGVTPEYNKMRKSRQYRNFVKAVFRRDKYTCQICDLQTWDNWALQVNHIKKFSDYPTLRTEPSNGITLCVGCHRMVTGHEEEWESYFLFNLATRGFIPNTYGKEIDIVS